MSWVQIPSPAFNAFSRFFPSNFPPAKRVQSDDRSAILAAGFAAGGARSHPGVSVTAMIRKAVIVVLTLGAVGMAVIAVTSFRPRESRFHSDLLFHSDVFFCTSRDGVLKLFFHRCPNCGSHGKHVVTCVFWDLPSHFGKAATLSDLRFGLFQWNVFQNPDRRTYVLSLPTLVLAMLFVAFPTIAFIRGPLRRRSRRRKGLCVSCGYDLTGNVTGVCSECGTRIVRSEGDEVA